MVSTSVLALTFSASLESAEQTTLPNIKEEAVDKTTMLLISTSTENAPISTKKEDKDDKEPLVDKVTTLSPTLPPSPIAQAPEPSSNPLTRRLVTFDQRQEGRFNVRADLENLLIVFITDPSEIPASGPSSAHQTLLDMLKKSAANSKANVNKSSSKKFKKDPKDVPLSELPDYSAFKVPSFKQTAKLPYYPQIAAQARSPYHVDIDSTLESRALYLPSPSNGPMSYQQDIDQPPLIQFLKAIPSA